jgi:hypothetical protein
MASRESCALDEQVCLTDAPSRWPGWRRRNRADGARQRPDNHGDDRSPRLVTIAGRACHEHSARGLSSSLSTKTDSWAQKAKPDFRKIAPMRKILARYGWPIRARRQGAAFDTYPGTAPSSRRFSLVQHRRSRSDSNFWLRPVGTGNVRAPAGLIQQSGRFVMCNFSCDLVSTNADIPVLRVG